MPGSQLGDTGASPVKATKFSSGRGAEVARVRRKHEVGGPKPPVLTTISTRSSCGNAAVSNTTCRRFDSSRPCQPHVRVTFVQTDAWPSGKAPVSKTGEARRSRATEVRSLQHPPRAEVAKFRKTREAQTLVRRKPRAGSTPALGTNLSQCGSVTERLKVAGC